MINYKKMATNQFISYMRRKYKLGPKKKKKQGKKRQRKNNYKKNIKQTRIN